MLKALAAQLQASLAGLGALAAQARALPWWAGALLAAAGLAMLLFGARGRRPIALVGGAVIGALGALVLHPQLPARLAVDQPTFVAIGAAALAIACVALPPVFPFAAGALPGVLFGLHFPLAGSGRFGAAVGALIGGSLALVFGATVAALVAAAIGASLLAGGLLAIAGPRFAAADVAARPFLLLGFVVVLTIAGAAFQRNRAWGRAGGAARGRDAAPLQGP